MFQRRWTSEKIISHILAREGVEPLNSHYYATTYPDVYAAAERFFGSWCNTLESCGFSYQEIRKYRTWNRERVLNEIRKLSEVHSPLSSKFVQTDHRPLYMAALKRFGNWGNATRAGGSGIPPHTFAPSPDSGRAQGRDPAPLSEGGKPLLYLHAE